MDPSASNRPSPTTSESAAPWLRSAARAFGISGARSHGWIARGTIVDRRYHVVRALGAGAMAVVLLAWDLELDRAVALKLYDHDIHDAARSRTHREARAMAALAHPNVATIYGIGVHEARLYIAMEFIDGGTLGAWLRRERPSQQQVVAVFQACARGLAAAHAAGIVHGDVKPSNLLVDVDGRPRVADFGLARLAHGVTAARLCDEDRRAPAFFGTPRYAAPEQHGTHELDGRADQFALCVALHEALYDEHPFFGDDADTLIASIRGGRRRGRASGRPVPRALARVIERGLAHAPADRFATMDELAAALHELPWRRRFWLGIGTLAAAGVMVASWSESPGCAQSEAGVERVWNGERELAITQAFQNSGSPFYRDVLDATTAALDEWSDRWRSDRHQACTAMPASVGSDADLLDRRIRCLDRQLVALDVVVDALGRADRETVTRALDLVTGLPEPVRCDDVVDASQLDAPADPELALQLDAEREQLARARAALELGRHGEAAELAIAVVRSRAAQARPELHGEALLLLGLARRDAGELEAAELALTDAHHDAVAAGDDATAANAAIELVCVLSHVPGGSARAPGWLRTAEATTRRRGASSFDDARIGLCRGDLWLAEGRHVDAERAYRRALHDATTVAEPEPTTMARLHAGIGNALFDRGRLTESLAAHDQAYALVVGSRAARRPDGIAIQAGRAGMLTRIGRSGEGLAAQLACLEAAIAALGSDAAALPAIYDDIALSLVGLGAPPLAIAYAERGVVVARARAETAAALPSLLSRLASAYDEMGRSETGLRLASEAIAAAELSYGPEHPVTARMIANYGVALLGLNRDDEAAVALARGLEIIRGEYGETHPSIGIICLNFVQLFWRREQPAIAEVYLAWAERVAAANDDARLEMAVVMWRGLSLMLGGELERSLPPLERAALLAHRVDPHMEQKLLRDIGYVQLDLDHPAAAMEVLRRSHAIAAFAGNLGEVTVTNLAMATASWRLGKRTAGRRLALEALAIAEHADHRAHAEHARAWLAEHGGAIARTRAR